MGPARIGDLRLYLGDRHDAKDRSLLRSLKITAVLNCTPPRDESSTGCPNFFEKEPTSSSFSRMSTLTSIGLVTFVRPTSLPSAGQ